MLIIWSIVVFISLAYILIILLFTFGWIKIPQYKNKPESLLTAISVIIPVRNEEKYICNLIEDILKQDLKSDLFEVIIIDDKSTDKTITIVNELIATKENCKLLSLTDKLGKKEAISLGISNAKNELIITTDADCRVNEKWLSTLIGFYEKYQPKMIIGPVVLDYNNLFEGVQSLEFLSLISSTAGAVGIKRPIMCNGANLAFEKSAYIETFSDADKKIISGDDVFLLHSIKKKYKNEILYLKSKDFIVRTTPVETLKGFIDQRLRWTSKSRSYKDPDTIFISIIVLLMNISIMILGIWSIFDIEKFYPFISVLSSKLLVDSIFLATTSSFFKRSKLLLLSIPIQFFYPIYISLIGILGNIIPYDWKGRKTLKNRY